MECASYYIKFRLFEEGKEKELATSYIPFHAGNITEAYTMFDGILTKFSLDYLPPEGDTQWDKFLHTIAVGIPTKYRIRIRLHLDRVNKEREKNEGIREEYSSAGCYVPFEAGNEEQALLIWEGFLKKLPLRTGEEHWVWKPNWAEDEDEVGIKKQLV